MNCGEYARIQQSSGIGEPVKLGERSYKVWGLTIVSLE